MADRSPKRQAYFDRRRERALAKHREIAAAKAVTKELRRNSVLIDALLRRIETDFTNICPACDRTRSGGHEAGCTFAALLKRLDESRARAGG